MNLEKILKDLYEIDQNLREHDAELRQAVKLMLESRPQIKLAKDFEKELRAELLAYAKTLNQKTKFILNFNPMKKFLYAFGGVALAALVIVPLVYHPGQTGRIAENSGEVDFNTGNLTMSEDGSEEFDLNLDNYGGENGVSVAVADQASSVSGRGGVMLEKALSSSYAPYPSYDQSYIYKYVGKDVELKDAQLPVLKLKTDDQKVAISEVLKDLKVDVWDFNKFENLNVSNLSVYEDKDEGYEIFVDFRNSSINIYRNWDSWNKENKDSDKFAIDKDDVNEGEIIAVANAFIQKYGIGLENYGQPELVENLMVIMRSEYKPESYSVIYPLLVDGKKVVSNWGSLVGLTVNVDLRSGQVNNLYGISSQSYEGKNYSATQDFSAIKKYVEDMGYSKLSFEEDADKQSVEVQTPEVVWMQYSSYNGKTTQEYLVPALRFEAEYPEDNNWNNQNVVVPLVKDMFERLIEKK